MHAGISENRQLILADRKANSTTRINVSTIRENLERLDRSMSTFVYTSSERINVLYSDQAANTKLFEEFNNNLKTQLDKMVEDFHKSNQQYGEILKQISTL
jgi:hypothetical protein